MNRIIQATVQNRSLREIKIPRRVTLIVVIPFLSALLLLLLWVFISSNSKSSRPAVVGPPASWEAQVASAQEAAWRLDKTAVLYDVAAYPYNPQLGETTPYTDPQRSPLEMYFQFAESSGSQIIVSFQDSAPDTTLDIVQASHSVPSGIQEQTQKYMNIFALVKVSPREALQSTWRKAQTQAVQDKVDLSPTISLNIATIPTAWIVSYRSPGVYELQYTVNTGDGTILLQGH